MTLSITGKSTITVQEADGTPVAATDTIKLPNGSVAANADGSVTYTPTEAALSTTDITTNDVSTTKHGLTPKAPNDTTKFLRGDATWAAPAGGSTDVLMVQVFS